MNHSLLRYSGLAVAIIIFAFTIPIYGRICPPPTYAEDDFDDDSNFAGSIGEAVDWCDSSDDGLMRNITTERVERYKGAIGTRLWLERGERAGCIWIDDGNSSYKRLDFDYSENPRNREECRFIDTETRLPDVPTTCRPTTWRFTAIPASEWGIARSPACNVFCRSSECDGYKVHVPTSTDRDPSEPRCTDAECCATAGFVEFQDWPEACDTCPGGGCDSCDSDECNTDEEGQMLTANLDSENLTQVKIAPRMTNGEMATLITALRRDGGFSLVERTISVPNPEGAINYYYKALQMLDQWFVYIKIVTCMEYQCYDPDQFDLTSLYPGTISREAVNGYFDLIQQGENLRCLRQVLGMVPLYNAVECACTYGIFSKQFALAITVDAISILAPGRVTAPVTAFLVDTTGHLLLDLGSDALKSPEDGWRGSIDKKGGAKGFFTIFERFFVGGKGFFAGVSSFFAPFFKSVQKAEAVPLRCSLQVPRARNVASRLARATSRCTGSLCQGAYQLLRYSRGAIVPGRREPAHPHFHVAPLGENTRRYAMKYLGRAVNSVFCRTKDALGIIKRALASAKEALASQPIGSAYSARLTVGGAIPVWVTKGNAGPVKKAAREVSVIIVKRGTNDFVLFHLCPRP